MKSAVIPIIVLLLCTAGIAPSRAGQSEENWRTRTSFRYDTAAMSDIVEEIRFGREVAARIIGRYGLYENPSIMKYVNLVGQTLAQGTNRPELEFHFAVLKSDEIAAVAAPGGYVFVTQGALRMMQDEAELAGVLAHELAHVSEKHLVRELDIHAVDETAVSGLAQVISGSAGSAEDTFVQAVHKAMAILFKDGYPRDDETQADKDAVLYCAMAGYDPSGLVRYFERISVLQGKQTDILDRTHPQLGVRIGHIKATLAHEGIDPGAYNTYKMRFTETMKTMK